MAYRKTAMTKNAYEYTRPLKLHELESLLFEDDSIEEVTLFPPEDGNITDEESGEEDEFDISHLPGRILRSEVEVKLSSANPSHEDNYEDAPEEAVYPSTATTSTSKEALKKKSKTLSNSALVWTNDLSQFIAEAGRGDVDEILSQSVEPNTSSVEWFELLFSNDVFELITDMSNLYALQRNHTLNVTVEEIKVYVAILLLTGYMTPKYIRMFWEVKSDTHNEAVANSMRRNRFLEIQQYLHLCDNLNIPENDKFGKVRKYFDTLSDNFLANYEKHSSSHISIDETMIPYYGRHSTKQHIHGKPIRFGYKLWSAASRNGYLITFEPYQGAKSAQLTHQEEFGLGAAVILEIESRLPKNVGPYNFYFDNFFTSLSLLNKLTENGDGGTGTIRENRLKNCPLVSSKLLKKEKRGSFSFKVTNNISVVKWHDNNVVSLASNCHSVCPVQKVDRVGTVNGKRSRIQVDCPAVVTKYNKYMGGVDRFDENVDSMRIGLRGKKWWFPLFAFGIDAACQNSWQLMRNQTKDKVTYCQFRRIIVQTYLAKYGNPQKRRSECGVPVEKRVLPEVRLSGPSTAHTQESCSQRRCGHCHQRTRIMCRQCKVGLHIHCWYDFHAK